MTENKNNFLLIEYLNHLKCCWVGNLSLRIKKDYHCVVFVLPWHSTLRVKRLLHLSQSVVVSVSEPEPGPEYQSPEPHYSAGREADSKHEWGAFLAGPWFLAVVMMQISTSIKECWKKEVHLNCKSAWQYCACSDGLNFSICHWRCFLSSWWRPGC